MSGPLHRIISTDSLGRICVPIFLFSIYSNSCCILWLRSVSICSQQFMVYCFVQLLSAVFQKNNNSRILILTVLCCYLLHKQSTTGISSESDATSTPRRDLSTSALLPRSSGEPSVVWFPTRLPVELLPLTAWRSSRESPLLMTR